MTIYQSLAGGCSLVGLSQFAIECIPTRMLSEPSKTSYDPKTGGEVEEYGFLSLVKSELSDDPLSFDRCLVGLNRILEKEEFHDLTQSMQKHAEEYFRVRELSKLFAHKETDFTVPGDVSMEVLDDALLKYINTYGNTDPYLVLAGKFLIVTHPSYFEFVKLEAYGKPPKGAMVNYDPTKVVKIEFGGILSFLYPMR